LKIWCVLKVPFLFGYIGGFDSRAPKLLVQNFEKIKLRIRTKIGLRTRLGLEIKTNSIRTGTHNWPLN
jgi:hypothetical protein